MDTKTDTNTKRLGVTTAVRLRDGQLILTDDNGRVAITSAGPVATLELAVVDGRIEVVCQLGTERDELWPFDDGPKTEPGVHEFQPSALEALLASEMAR